MLDKRPYQGSSKVCWLQELCNKYGDFRVAIAYMKDGDIRWSHHHTVLECWHSDEGLDFLSKVTNRGAMPTEIRIDIDPKESESPQEIKVRFDDTCDILETKGITYNGWFSGSKGYHIHTHWPKILQLGYSEKNLVKEYLIQLLGGELLKVTDTSMLTLEWAPNNKTGKPKIPIRGDFNWLTI